MQMLSLLGFGLVAIALTLQGCGGGGTPSPTPVPPSPSPSPGPPSPGPSPDTPTGYSYKNSTLALGPGISASGLGASGTLSYEMDVFIVNGTILKKLYMEHKDAFMPDAAKSIEALLDSIAIETVTGPAMNLMVSSLLGSKSSDFLGMAFSSDSLVHKVRAKGEIEFSSTSSFPMTYYPCISVLEIASSLKRLNARLMGLYIPDILTCRCRRFGTQQEEEHTSSLMIV